MKQILLAITILFFTSCENPADPYFDKAYAKYMDVCAATDSICAVAKKQNNLKILSDHKDSIQYYKGEVMMALKIKYNQ